ncbi:MAG TPA: T9SS type A sorting domain-containing protein, partial [Ignavibacteria bacterium]|nr:T9SS type A sorting domain-containing protein [Ignavibacteria bacterium]
CESDPYLEPYAAYLMMTGAKKDSTPFLNPTIVSGTGTRKTKYVYSGDPETNTGWTEKKGCIQNCGGDTSNTGQLGTNPPGDRRFIMSSGSFNLNVAPNEKQILIAAQMAARTYNYKNAVTRVKLLSDSACNWYNSHPIGIKKIGEVVPVKYQLYQNYPNPFNPATIIKFDIPKSDFVTIDIYDITGKLVSSLLNEYKTSGTYEIKFEAANLASGVYFCKMSSNAFSDVKRMVFIK